MVMLDSEITSSTTEANLKQTSSSYSAGDGINLYVCEWLPDGPPESLVLLVHGLGEHSGRYQHVAEFFTRNSIALFSFDLRGHGRSGGVRGHAASYDAIMGDIDAFLKQIGKRFPSTPLFLYGHSLGGNLVLYHLLNRKSTLTGAIVTSPGLRTAEEVPGWKVALGKILYSLVPSFQMDNGLDVTGLSRNQAVVDAYQADPLVHPKVSARLGMDLIENGRSILAKAASLEVPTLLMVGSADRIIEPQAVREFAAGAGKMVNFREWPEGYHELHNDLEQAAILQIMVEWIKSHTASKLVEPVAERIKA